MTVKRRLVRIGPLQLGKMLAALYGALALMFIPFIAVFAAIGAFAQKQANMPANPGAMFAGLGIVLIILFPLVYAAMGFIIGLIGAAIYNLLAKWIGGIEVEVE